MLDLNKILKEIVSMRELIKNGNTSTKELKKKFPYTYKNTPTLFDMVIANDTEYMIILDGLFRKAKEVQKDKTKFEEYSKEVGEQMATKYIYPLIDKSKEPHLQDQ